MEYTLIITGDENDADYKSRESNIEEEDLIIIKKFVELIKKNKNRENWEDHWEDYKDKVTLDEFDIFNSFVPYVEYGIHTIVSIKIAPRIDWEELM